MAEEHPTTVSPFPDHAAAWSPDSHLSDTVSSDADFVAQLSFQHDPDVPHRPRRPSALLPPGLTATTLLTPTGPQTPLEPPAGHILSDPIPFLPATPDSRAASFDLFDSMPTTPGSGPSSARNSSQQQRANFGPPPRLASDISRSLSADSEDGVPLAALLKSEPSSPPSRSARRADPLPEVEKRSRRSSLMGGKRHASLSGPQASGGVSLGLSLTNNILFYDIPMTDALSDLIEKHFPPDQRPARDLAGLIEAEKSKSPDALRELVMNNSWRAVARSVRHKITHTNPSHIDEILQLWYTRLLALTKLRLYQLASAEFDRLGDLDRAELTYEYHQGLFPGQTGSMVPFDLRVLWAKLPAWLGNTGASVQRVVLLIVFCKKMATRLAAENTNEATQEPRQWHAREAQLYLLIVNYLIELQVSEKISGEYVPCCFKFEFFLDVTINVVYDLFLGTQDYPGATRAMQTIARIQPTDVNTVAGIGRLYLQLGNIDAAHQAFQQVEATVDAWEREIEAGGTVHVDAEGIKAVKETVVMNRAFNAMASGDWEQAKGILTQALERNGENLVAANNLAVCELYLGNLNGAISTLQNLLTAHPTTAGTCEPLLFNLCTLFELRSENAQERKIALMRDVGRWAGDAFGVECLKIA
ncbi:hypothetical protein BC937DRAFT_95611 [Endogone sp. FLAS-F59071]|nr:hypothetical protein BC937DRAFT_95611 [Endogone sp. FLAS-F59071]|eukprot:RUS20237.1 hypothetical protein BC937DRAFT_95611 [Endogone sp. FLAS-F59071]